jgi:hypothetical protein
MSHRHRRSGAELHPTGVADDSPQPRRHRVRIAEVPDAAQCDQRAFLHGVFRVGAVPEDAQRDRAHVRLVSSQQQSESADIAGLRLVDQVDVYRCATRVRRSVHRHDATER